MYDLTDFWAFIKFWNQNFAQEFLDYEKLHLPYLSLYVIPYVGVAHSMGGEQMEHAALPQKFQGVKVIIPIHLICYVS